MSAPYKLQLKSFNSLPDGKINPQELTLFEQNFDDYEAFVLYQGYLLDAVKQIGKDTVALRKSAGAGNKS